MVPNRGTSTRYQWCRHSITDRYRRDGVLFENLTTKYGRSHTTCRVRTTSHYARAQQKLNVIVAIESGNPRLPRNISGSVERPRRWVFITGESVNQLIFGDFIETTLSDIERHPVPGNFDNTRCLMWDNLAAHKTAYVTHIIRDRVSNNNFYSVDRPPYRPKIAPIEYIFCELAGELSRRCKRDWDVDDVRANIYQIMTELGTNGRFCNTFIHCGYPQP